MTMFDPEKITYFAKTDSRGSFVPFGIKAKDRQRHMYVVGKTGMGKSTLLENMAAQDIINGEGMAFIDPHGSAAETLLEYIPEHRIKDVVYFAPFDLEHPVALISWKTLVLISVTWWCLVSCRRLKRFGWMRGVRVWSTSSRTLSWC